MTWRVISGRHYFEESDDADRVDLQACKDTARLEVQVKVVRSNMPTESLVT
jgi:hypothetical protein